MKQLTLLIFIILIAFSNVNSQSNMNYIVKEECLCANTSDNYDKMTKISVRKDKDALMKMVQSEEVFILEKGDNVELIDGGISKSKVVVITGKLKGKTVFVSPSFLKKQ